MTLIVRVMADDGVMTFDCTQPLVPNMTEQEAKKASLEIAGQIIFWVKRTSAAGFVAEVRNPDDMRGKILKKWDNKELLYGDKFIRRLCYNIRGGAYSDTVYAYLGTEDSCSKRAEKINKDCKGWWCTSARIEQLCGPLWQCVVTKPYLD